MAGAYRFRTKRNSSAEYCRHVPVTDLARASRHFAEHGWVAVDALAPIEQAALTEWVDEIAVRPDGDEGILQHFEGTDDGPLLCRSENFVPAHAGLRALLCAGAMLEVAGALLGEPAVLYKEKINYKLAGGAGTPRTRTRLPTR